VSRAVRTPSPADTDLRVNLTAAPGAPPILIALMGNQNFESEVLRAFEVGYRGEVSHRLILDAAAFYNRYSNLMSLEPGSPAFETDPAPPHLLLPLRLVNRMTGDTYGVEVAAKWQVTDTWRLSLAYTWFKARAHLDPGSGDTTSKAAMEGDNPGHQAQVLSRLDLPKRFELDASLYYVGKLPNLDVPAYTRLDVRLGWRPLKDVELSLAAQNLTDKRHLEFAADSSGLQGSEVPRSVYGKVTWKF
jgi:iron complex outermembrane receptor protein